jgi:hypothetical protein
MPTWYKELPKCVERLGHMRIEDEENMVDDEVKMDALDLPLAITVEKWIILKAIE